ncbi:hypothetical protein OG784_12855 [Streptomyces sp. NBC_01617]|uniref:hypothetical protein n=1 Tax=Streptomyces sp. NBC_01617 TaxID=2975899 RepID=UPI00386A316F|nr:hypothetical protein OG784_12855 [Streptomyces sp. NBC_01617]
MASALYPSFKQLLLSGGIDLTSADIRAIIVDSADYTYSAAHDFLDDVPAGARVAVSGALASKTVTGGVFDAADVTYNSVSGDSVEAIVLYKHTGTETTSNLIAYIDGVSVTPNGGNITVTWNASGIFAL